MSIFGRIPGGKSTVVGVHEAVAEEIASQFGVDDEMDDADLLGDDDILGDEDLLDEGEWFGADDDDIDELARGVGAMAAAEVELDIDDELIENELEDLVLGLEDDDELDEETEPVYVPEPHSERVALADQVRYGLFGGLKGLGKKAGRMEKRQEIRSLRLQKRQTKQELAKASPLGQMLASAVEGMSSASPTSEVSSAPASPGAPWWQSLVQQVVPQASTEASPAAPLGSSLVRPSASSGAVSVHASPAVEAGATTMPPVYVADEVKETEDVTVGKPTVVEVAGEFGATVRTGWRDRQRRSGAKKGVDLAVARSSVVMGRLPYGDPSTFVEDPNAKPVLLGNGQIFDQAYGEMTAVPCPSCCHISQNAAYGGMGRSCCVCDGYGAVLVPVNDVPSYGACAQYGIIPLLVPLIGAAATAGSSMALGGFQSSKAKEAEAAEENKYIAMKRLLKIREQAKQEAKAKEEKKTEKKPEKKSKSEDEDFGFDDTDLFDDEFGLDDDELELGDDDFGLDDDGDFEDEFGIDEWADDVFGADSDEFGIDLDDDEDFGEDDETEDFSDEASSCVTYGLVRVMVPGDWR